MALVAEHAAMTGQNAWAFLLVGSASRVIRLLALDRVKESNTPPNAMAVIELESSRRLVWSCFLLDTQIGSGVDDNLNWRADAPQIALPCSEDAFTYGISPPGTELADLTLFPNLPEHYRTGLRSNIIYVMWLRSQSLR